MPVQYRSILEEHRAVRTTAGLFDVSHMGEIRVTGDGATAFLNHLLTNDVARLVAGRVLYSPMCLPDGGVVDDLLVSCVAPGDFLLCVNASNREKDLAWIEAQAAGFDCRIRDQSADFGLLAVQGPAADTVIARLSAVPVASLRYYSFVEGEVAGVGCLISRTGYTGDRGFELFCPAGRASPLARSILEAGAPDGLVLAGLGARDSLRLEAGFSLYGHEISESISPIEAGLQWTVNFAKPDFIGRDALFEQHEKGPRSRIAFFRTGDRRIVRAGADVLSGEKPVGRVVSGTLSPILNEAIGSMHVAVDSLCDTLTADLRGHRQVLEVTQPPFVPLRR